MVRGKWKLPVLIAIDAGVTRFRELYKVIAPITTHSLSNELKELEAQNLVVRNTNVAASAKTVRYTLSSAGKDLTCATDVLTAWYMRHHQHLS